MRKITFDIETKNFFQEVGKADPALLDICVVAIHDSKDDSYQTFMEEELAALWPILENADILIGYNSDHFDIPLLNKYYPGDLTKIKSIDLLKEIRSSIGKRLKLDSIAEATLGEHKSGNGMDAVIWYRNGEIEKVKKYCIDDVRITKQLYEYARKHQLLKYKDGTNLIDIKLDTSRWEEPEKTSMTFTLPF